MKIMSVFSSIFFMATLAQAATVELSAGSTARIRAGEEMIVSCSGSSGGGSECTLKSSDYSNLFYVYAGEARVSSVLTLAEAGALIRKLKDQGVCR